MMFTKRFYFKKGLFLALTLIILNKILSFYFETNSFDDSSCYFIAVLFMIFTVYFLVADKISHLLITGFIGLFALIGSEILLTVIRINALSESGWWHDIYLNGFVGSIVGTIIAIVLTILKVKPTFSYKEMNSTMDKSMKTKLLIYAVLSAFSFTYLILPENAALSVPIFIILQFICLWFIIPNKKSLWVFIPIFILSLNSFISGNNIWHTSNFFVIIILYSFMFVDFDIKDTTARFLADIFKTIAEPFKHIHIPFQWSLNANKEKAPIIKRVLIALAITIPSIIILLITLSFADMVFSVGVNDFFTNIFKNFNVKTTLNIISGILVGLYLFGLLYSSYFKKEKMEIEAKVRNGDLIILNILLISILAIYTLFVIIQFKCLFAGAALPYGLSYTEYARKGFFELFFLTGVNIAVILTTIRLTKNIDTKWGRITKWLCMYLCSVTIVLLVSSFYRMWLYNAEDGLTRLRFLVFGFLIFEAIGLFITFFYILKPKFNIIAVYLSIAMIYYLLLNIVPMDYFIAKSQVDRYFNGKTTGIPYTMTLSSDAAPQIIELLYSDTPTGVDDETRSQATEYFSKMKRYPKPCWQANNLSINTAQNIYITQTTRIFR